MSVVRVNHRFEFGPLSLLQPGPQTILQDFKKKIFFFSKYSLHFYVMKLVPYSTVT